jgi:hypothetical protein
MLAPSATQYLRIPPHLYEPDIPGYPNSKRESYRSDRAKGLSGSLGQQGPLARQLPDGLADRKQQNRSCG